MYEYSFLKKGLQKGLIVSTFASLLLFSLNAQAAEDASTHIGKYDLAHKVTAQEFQSWDISIFPNGKNLPEGKGDYKTGKVLYDNQCMACHGDNGKGGIKLDPYRNPIETLVKSKNDSLIGEKPKKNIGTFWQYAPSLFDYMRRTMPYQAPKSLSADELYALTAYLLAENGIISKNMLVNKNNIAKIKMPNVDGFICDNSVDTKSLPCMENCPLPDDKDFNKNVKIDNKDYLKSDCLVQPKIEFEVK